MANFEKTTLSSPLQMETSAVGDRACWCRSHSMIPWLCVFHLQQYNFQPCFCCQAETKVVSQKQIFLSVSKEPHRCLHLQWFWIFQSRLEEIRLSYSCSHIKGTRNEYCRWFWTAWDWKHLGRSENRFWWKALSQSSAKQNSWSQVLLTKIAMTQQFWDWISFLVMAPNGWVH